MAAMTDLAQVSSNRCGPPPRQRRRKSPNGAGGDLLPTGGARLPDVRGLLCGNHAVGSVVPPLLAHIDSWRQAHPEPVCTVVLPEVMADHSWAYWLHNHGARWLKAALLSRSMVAVADVTYHLLGERST